MTSAKESTDAISPFVAVLIVIATFVLLVFMGALFLVLLGLGPALIATELLILVIPLGYMLLKGIDIRRYVGLDVNTQNILLGILLGSLVFLADIVISSVLFAIFGASKAVEESNQQIMDLSSSSWGLLSAAIALSLAGICEEFTFRGFLMNTITRRYSFVPALLVSSLAFGLFHFDLQLVYIISAFTVGLILGYIYHRWHSYLVCAVTHSTVNLIVLAITIFIR